MIRWGVGVVVALLVTVAMAWNAGQNSVEKRVDPPKRQPTQAEQIIAFCSSAANKESPLCKVDPDEPNEIRDAVRDIVSRQAPQVVERERIVERSDDDDDDEPAPRVTINVPRQPQPAQTTRSPAPTTRPPLIPEVKVPEIPEVKVPNLDLPLLP
jgi:hypothetical protein